MEKPSNVLCTGLPTPNVTVWNVGWGIRGGGGRRVYMTIATQLFLASLKYEESWTLGVIIHVVSNLVDGGRMRIS